MKKKIAVFSAVLLGAVVGIFATISLIIDTFILDNLVGTIIDLSVMGFSYLTAWVGLRYMLMEKIANDELDKEWDYKIEPVVDLLTDTIGRVQGLEIDILRTNRKIDTTLDYVNKMQDMDASSVYIFPGASFKFITKVMVMIIFTFSALVYVTAYPLGIVHYFMLVLYLAWWALFTSEFHLFENKNAWIWGMAPIMTVPAGGIILDATLGLNNMVGILFSILFFYAYLYYSWAAALATGFKLIDLNKIHDFLIKNAQVQFQQQKVNRKINRRHFDAGILVCIAIAGVIAVLVFI